MHPIAKLIWLIFVRVSFKEFERMTENKQWKLTKFSLSIKNQLQNAFKQANPVSDFNR